MIENDLERICDDITRIQEEKKDNLKEMCDLNVKIKSLEREQDDMKRNLTVIETKCNKKKNEIKGIVGSPKTRISLDHLQLTFSCKQCQNRFSSKPELYLHIKDHHPKVYKCKE